MPYQAVASKPPIESYKFVRGASVDVDVVVRIYNGASQRIDAFTGTISSDVVDLAGIKGSALEVGGYWASFSYISATTSATTLLVETGADPDANSESFAVPASNDAGGYDTVTIGLVP